jgi:hypothetical protein
MMTSNTDHVSVNYGDWLIPNRGESIVGIITKATALRTFLNPFSLSLLSSEPENLIISKEEPNQT